MWKNLIISSLIVKILSSMQRWQVEPGMKNCLLCVALVLVFWALLCEVESIIKEWLG